MLKCEIFRYKSNNYQTLSTLSLWYDNILEFKCKAIELPWLNNKKNISCIPLDSYKLIKNNNDNNIFELLNVYNREKIFIKCDIFNNIKSDIIIGLEYKKINDNIVDLIYNNYFIEKLNYIIGNQTEIILNIN